MDTCLFHCTLFIYMEMKWCALQACLLVCLVRQGQWKENKNCLCAGKFSQRRLSCHYFRAKGKEGPMKEMSSVTGSQNSHLGEEYTFFWRVWLRCLCSYGHATLGINSNVEVLSLSALILSGRKNKLNVVRIKKDLFIFLNWIKVGLKRGFDYF